MPSPLVCCHQYTGDHDMRCARLVTLVLVPLVLAARSSTRKPDPHSLSPTTTGGAIVGRTTLGMPIPIPGQSTILVPFAIESEKDWFQTRDPFSAGGMGATSNSLGLASSLSEGDFSPGYARRYRQTYA